MLTDDELLELADRMEATARVGRDMTQSHCQDCDDAARGIRQLMQERDNAIGRALEKTE